MIKIENLYFSYSPNTPYILENISLDIPKGVFLSVVGENGSSKTTLLKLILGLLKPSKGSVTLNTNSYAYVPQKISAFNHDFPITVFEVLKSHLNTSGLSDVSEIDRVLSLLHMEMYKNQLIGNLSGGQQQRIFIARALIGNPDLILLDEPTSAMDQNMKDELYSFLLKLNREFGKTLIIIEHDLDRAKEVSTHVLKLHDKKACYIK